MRIEFAVDKAWPHSGHTMVAGRVHEADIALGDVFTSLAESSRPTFNGSDAHVGEPSPAHPVRLRVDGIEAYQHSLEVLPSGMTGMLRLRGSGDMLLQKVEASGGCGAWLLQGSKIADPGAATDRDGV